MILLVRGDEMTSKPLFLTAHARRSVLEREIDLSWIELTIADPDRSEPDPLRPGVERRFRRIPEFGDRILRVALVESPAEIRILTAFFDRKARLS